MKNLSAQVRLQIDETSTSKKYWDSKVKEAGFKDTGNIEDFLEYFKFHSQTPRALFSGQHIEIVLALGGYSEQERKEINFYNQFAPIHYNSENYEILEKKVGSLN